MRSELKIGRLLGLVLVAVAIGCSSFATLRQAQIAEQRGEWDAAVLHYLELTRRDPGNARYKSSLLRAKISASQGHFERGKRFHEAGVLDRALVEYQQAAQLDPTNQYAAVELDRVREQVASARGAEPLPLTLDEMKAKTRDASAQPPVLNPRSKEPISLNFPKPVSIFDIYRALGKAYGINVLFDPNLRDQNIAIELAEVTAQDALEILMRAAGHFYKVVDERSIIVAADNPQNRRVYEDLVIQTFFLSNAEVKDAVNLVRSLIGAKNVSPNEQLNAITIRDTADKVKVAQRIIEAVDKSKAEVVIDVELIQVNTTKLLDMGVSLSSYQIGQSLDNGGDGPIRFPDLQNITQQSWALTVPSIIYDFVKTNSDAQLLAKPQVRITEGEKANLHIGDKVPIPVTSFNTSGTIGGNIVPVTSFQYQDVGIRIQIEPRVHHNKEITLKLNIEVSQITGYISGSGGQSQPIIGTRNIESTIRLKDGETNFLAGLIRTDETKSESGLPGLSELPLIGYLFGKTRTEAQRTDVLLTLTPTSSARRASARPTCCRSGWARSRTSPSAAAARGWSRRSTPGRSRRRPVPLPRRCRRRSANGSSACRAGCSRGPATPGRGAARRRRRRRREEPSWCRAGRPPTPSAAGSRRSRSRRRTVGWPPCSRSRRGRSPGRVSRWRRATTRWRSASPRRASASRRARRWHWR
ncbi:MAG: hypothetical protein M5U13_12820 [Thermoanaerobaculia bacterium]|nr:hypothetical protein [Thermoanaerobaculia bacterium]